MTAAPPEPTAAPDNSWMDAFFNDEEYAEAPTATRPTASKSKEEDPILKAREDKIALIQAHLASVKDGTVERGGRKMTDWFSAEQKFIICRLPGGPAGNFNLPDPRTKGWAEKPNIPTKLEEQYWNSVIEAIKQGKFDEQFKFASVKLLEIAKTRSPKGQGKTTLKKEALKAAEEKVLAEKMG